MKIATVKRELRADQVMTKPVHTVRTHDSVKDVAHLFTEKNIGAAAVVNSEGKAIGVITKTDIVRYEEEKDDQFLQKRDLRALNSEPQRPGYHLVDADEVVENWMTPVIFSVKPETRLKDLARRMVRYGTHHIFVSGKTFGSLAGIVSSFDVLRQVAAGEV